MITYWIIPHLIIVYWIIVHCTLGHSTLDHCTLDHCILNYCTLDWILDGYNCNLGHCALDHWALDHHSTLLDHCTLDHWTLDNCTLFWIITCAHQTSQMSLNHAGLNSLITIYWGFQQTIADFLVSLAWLDIFFLSFLNFLLDDVLKKSTRFIFPGAHTIMNYCYYCCDTL